MPRTAWANTMLTTMTNITGQYSMIMPGLTIMPTLTKKTAPKRFLTGAMAMLMFSACLGEYAAHHEGSKCTTVSGVVAEYDKEETEGEGDYHEGLLVHVTSVFLEYQR